MNALCGAVGLLLIMTGDQNQVVFIYGYATLINIVLNGVLISQDLRKDTIYSA